MLTILYQTDIYKKTKEFNSGHLTMRDTMPKIAQKTSAEICVRQKMVVNYASKTTFLAIGLAVFAAGFGLSNSADAESLPSALKSAYRNHPGLQADRARQRGVDENVSQALSGWRPTVSANADAGAQWSNSTGFKTSKTNPAGFSITLNQPIFRGFKTVSGTKQAEAVVNASRQQLLSVEQGVLLDGATAYMDVIRDQDIAALRRKNVSFLISQLAASNARFAVGEITRTDVAQSRARLASSRADLAVARSNLAASIASYIRVIGHRPSRLRFPGISRSVPRSLQAALNTASKTSPSILAAAFNLEAAQQNIKVLKGDLLPTLSLQAQYSLRSEPTSTIKRTGTGVIQGVVSIPLYQAGRVYSQVRQAKQQASERQLLILDTRRQVRQSVVSTWNAFVASRQTITSIKAQVSANALALSGVRQEALVGSRTTLDILDAKRELVNSQVTLAVAQRNKVVAAYQLIAATGRMTARHLRLSVAIHDPSVNARRVRDQYFGANIK